MNFLHQIGFIQYPLLAYSLMTFVALWTCIHHPTLEIRRTVRWWGLVTFVLGILGTVVTWQQMHFPHNFSQSDYLKTVLEHPFPTSLIPFIWGTVVAFIAVIGVAITPYRPTHLPYSLADSEHDLS